jgi:hypothetical protein
VTVFVDEVRVYGPGYPMSAQTRRASPSGRWSHMTTDQADLAELHKMAGDIGMKGAWFQNKQGFPHYDVVPSKRAAAVKLGAVETTTEELVRMRRALASS